MGEAVFSNRHICALACFMLFSSLALADEPQLWKVLIHANKINDIAVHKEQVWFATGGGIKCLDRETNQWTFYTYYDGLAGNNTLQLFVDEEEVITFAATRICVFDKGQKRWRSEIVDPDTAIKQQWGHSYGNFVVQPDSIWFIHSHSPDFDGMIRKTLEVCERSRSEGKILRRIDLMDIVGRGWCLGMAAQGQTLWIAFNNKLVAVEMKTGLIEAFPLPEEAKVVNPVNGKRSENDITGMGSDNQALWLGLEYGLARFDIGARQFRFYFNSNDTRMRRISQLEPANGNVWLGISEGWFLDSSSLIQFEPDSGRLIQRNHDKIESISCLTAGDGELWFGCSPGGVGRWQYNPVDWEFIAHQAPPPLSEQMVLFEHLLLTWGIDWIEDAPRDALFSYDLNNDTLHSRPTPPPVMMIPDGERIWMISDNRSAEYFPLTDQWRDHEKFDISAQSLAGASVIAVHGRKYWISLKDIKSANDINLYVFDADTGHLEEVMVTKNKGGNARPLTVSKRYFYLEQFQRIKRYDLQQQTWEELPLKHSNPRAVCAFGQVWLFNAGQIVAISDDQPASSTIIQRPQGPIITYINGFRKTPESLEFIYGFHEKEEYGAIRFDGESWFKTGGLKFQDAETKFHVMPSMKQIFEGRNSLGSSNATPSGILPLYSYSAARRSFPFFFEGVNRDGSPTGTFAAVHHGLAFWRGEIPQLYSDEQFKPLVFGPESGFLKKENSERMLWEMWPSSGSYSDAQAQAINRSYELMDDVRNRSSNLRFDQELQQGSDEQKMAAIVPLLKKLDVVAEECAGLEKGVEALFEKAGILRAMDYQENAIEVYRTITEQYAQYPASVKARLMWADCLFPLKQYQEVIDLLQPMRNVGKDGSVYELHEYHWELLQKLTAAHARLGNVKEVELAHQELLHDYPEKADTTRNWYERRIKPILKKAKDK